MVLLTIYLYLKSIQFHYSIVVKPQLFQNQNETTRYFQTTVSRNGTGFADKSKMANPVPDEFIDDLSNETHG